MEDLERVWKEKKVKCEIYKGKLFEIIIDVI